MPLGGLEGGGGSAIVEVANYSALPAANTVTGELYAVLASQGTKWLPGSLGGTYYPKGLYYSDGVDWIYTETPYNANQATVDAGTNDDQFVTSKTFNDSAQLAAKAPLASPTFTGVVTTPDITVTGLTSTRVVFATTGGELTDDANLTFGSGNLNVGTSVTTPLLIGGSAVGSQLIHKSTTGNGTLTVAGHVFTGGNNGATTIMSMYNSGNVNIGNKTNTSQRLVRIGQGSHWIDLGNDSADGAPAIYLNATTPGITNYHLSGGANVCVLNAPVTQISFRVANVVRATFNDTDISFAPGAIASGVVAPFTFTTPASTNQTLSTETIGVRFNMSASIQHATGTIATQRDFVINARTHAFVGASTITNSATLAITGTPIAGTNATLTNRYTIWAQNGLSNFGTQAPVNSMSTNGLAIEAVSNSRTLSLYSTNQAISKTFSFDSNTGADNASINHYGTTYAGNFTGTSLPLLKSFDIQNGGSASINSVVIRGTPIVNIIGNTSSNAGTRLDATGFRIGTLANVHIANNYAFSNTTSISPWTTNGRGGYIEITAAGSYAFSANSTAPTGGLCARFNTTGTDAGSYPLIISSGSVGGTVVMACTGAGSVGFGTLSPVVKFHLNGANATATYMKVTNGTTTGVTATDGFNFGVSTTGVGEIRQYENLGIEVYTNNTLRATWLAGGGLTLADANDITTNATTGSKIGNGGKIGLFTATPIAQPTTGVAAATFVTNTSLIADDTATFDGYTIGQVVKALRNLGVLA